MRENLTQEMSITGQSCRQAIPVDLPTAEGKAMRTVQNRHAPGQLLDVHLDNSVRLAQPHPLSHIPYAYGS